LTGNVYRFTQQTRKERKKEEEKKRKEKRKETIRKHDRRLWQWWQVTRVGFKGFISGAAQRKEMVDFPFFLP